MTTHDTHDMLSTWHEAKHQSRWALAMIYQTEGHSYRKTGAFSLINELGEQTGVLSGGCLEADIRLMAQKCLALNKVHYKEYDGRDDDDVAYQLGCGGIVKVVFVPLDPTNQYLQLAELFASLSAQTVCYYNIVLDPHSRNPDSVSVSLTSEHDPDADVSIKITPKLHLLIVGGGQDALPVCQLAKQLGWRVSVWDPRGAYAREQVFTDADRIIKTPATSLTPYVHEQKVDFAVLMSHNVTLDADALAALADSSVQHVALLGPKKRFDDVIKATQINPTSFKPTLYGPAGLDIGGDLPVSIALSIVSQFHAVAHDKHALFTS